MSELFRGVLPAITTPFLENGEVDLPFLRRHARWMLDHGCRGIIALGSLGEGATLRPEEKRAILTACREELGSAYPTIATISATSTADAVALAQDAVKIGCAGLMVIPPYVHKGPWEEIRDHLVAVLQATELPAILYNNPSAYGFDLLPERIAELAEAHPTAAAVKESSGDVRRMTAVRALLGDRLALLAGLDDMAFEAGRIGADGWVAGLVNALPAESVRLFETSREGDQEEALALYRWFLPLLRLDTVPEFVQLIKAVQEEVGAGSSRVRAPRQILSTTDRERVRSLVQEHLDRHPLPASQRSQSLTPQEVAR